MEPNRAPATLRDETFQSQTATQRRELARLVLLVFLATFVCSRVLVLLIMARKVPDLYVHLGGTHVHHLNFGIFALAAVGGWLLWWPPTRLRLPAMMFGVGLGLTFDEFGMWLHLGGSYWQRASWDAVAVIAGLLGWFAYGPALRRYRPRHWRTAFGVLALASVFLYLLIRSVYYAESKMRPRLEQIESTGPP